MVSVGMSKLVCTNLIFVDPGEKINGCYYHELLLNQLLLTAIRQVSGDFFVLQVTRQCTGAQGTRDNQDAAMGDAAFISPDLRPPNSPVDYKIGGVMQDRVYQKKSEGRERVERATG